MHVISMQEAELNYFLTLLTSKLIELSEDLLSSIPPQVTNEETLEITRIPSRKEIRDVIFALGRNRSPGPDGFPADFYVACWDIIGTDLVQAIKEIFQGQTFPRSWKATFIALIPKVTNPNSFHEFRPISLCNVCYTIVSKIVTRCLRVFLDRLISPEQCQFVQGRHIHDNIMLVHKLAQSLDQDIHGFNVIIKLNMEKAFDII